MKLNRKFFNRNTVLVSQELLGKILVRKIGPSASSRQATIIKAKIIETEAYCGTKDLACHASKGLTERTKVMFGPPGHSYIYMIYGMYHCLNIVTEKEGNPSAVLIRGVELYRGPAPHYPRRVRSADLHATEIPLSATDFVRPMEPSPNTGVPTRATPTPLNGPGKLCRELKIDRNLNAVDLTKSDLLWIEDDEIKIKKSQIKKGKRIGVDYAGKWKDKLWRFYLG